MYTWARFPSRVLLVFLLLAVSSTLQQTTDGPIVETSLGKLQGNVLLSKGGADIYSFRGIRYAKAPVDELRFAAPVPVESWNDTLLVVADSLICPQPGPKAYMSENCLALNVFSRNLTGSAPVMVYIHGGANMFGSGHSLFAAGPQYLLDHDVVMVAFNYRLGALGFLSTRTAEAPGNYGYLDQVLALKWVQSHIANFGGDPNLVTIFGMSAGSMAVTLHLASPLSKGLFHRAIAMSGSATNHYAIDNLGWTQKLAREVSCPMYNPQDVVDCLRGVNWETIIDVCAIWELYNFVNMKWNYEVDGRFLMKHPNDAFSDGDFHKMPLLVGFTKNEFDFSAYHQESNTGLLNDISVNFDLYAPELFLYNATDDEDEWSGYRKSEQIKEFYLGKDAAISSNNLEQFGTIFSDAIIGEGVHRLVQLARQFVDVYYYRFDYVGSRSAHLNDDDMPRGAEHADDLQYIMPSTPNRTWLPHEHPDMFMVDRLTKWWTSFAKFGSPMSESEGGTVWEPTTVNKSVTLYNNKETYLSSHPYPERFALWEELFPVRTNGEQKLKAIGFFSLLIAALRVFI